MSDDERMQRQRDLEEIRRGYDDAEQRERMQRLTELARRVYGNQAVLEPVTRLSMSIAERGGWGVRCHGSVCIQVMGEHALDALEAALLAQTKPDGSKLLEVIDEIRAELTRDGARIDGEAVRRRMRGVDDAPDWVEQLASEWETKAREWLTELEPYADEDDHPWESQNAARMVLLFAKALRERAKRSIAHAPATSPSFDEALKQAEAALDRAAAGISQRPLVQEGPRSYVAAKEEREKGGEP